MRMATKRRHIEQLFKAHYLEMCRLGLVLLHDEEQSRDIVHDIFAKLLSGEIRFSQDKARSFLLTCMRNRCLNEMRNRSAREQMMRLYLTAGDPIQEPEMEILEKEDTFTALQAGISRLTPPICREIVLMHYRDGRPYKEIAAHFDVSETTIYKHLREAMNQLRLTLTQ